MAKMKRTYSYEWYGPCGYEEKEDSKKVSEEALDNSVITSQVIPFGRVLQILNEKYAPSIICKEEYAAKKSMLMKY